MTHNNVQKNIMRRVYYAFTLRIVSHPIVTHGALLLASVYALSVVVHVASVLENLSKIQVGDLGRYMLNTFANTELWTLALIGIILFTIISLPIRLRMPHFKETMQTV